MWRRKFVEVSELLSIRRLLRVILFLEGIVVGVVTGAIVAALRFLLDEADIIRPQNFFAV